MKIIDRYPIPTVCTQSGLDEEKTDGIWIDMRPNGLHGGARWRAVLTTKDGQYPVSGLLRQGEDTVLAAFIFQPGKYGVGDNFVSVSSDSIRNGPDYVRSLQLELESLGFSLPDSFTQPQLLCFNPRRLITTIKDFLDHPM